jgi:hypothetical protein
VAQFAAPFSTRSADSTTGASAGHPSRTSSSAVTRRAIPWSRLTLENKEIPATLNLTWDQRVSAVLAAVAGASLLLLWYRLELLALAAAALAAVLILNRRLYYFFFQRGGLVFTVACVTLHLLYYLYSGLSYLLAWLEYRLGGQLATRRRL